MNIQRQYYLLTWFFSSTWRVYVYSELKAKTKKKQTRKPHKNTNTKKKKPYKGRTEALLGHVGCIPQIPAPSLPPKDEIRLSLWCIRSLLMSLGINMQKRGLCGRGSSKGKKRQSRIAALPGRTINLCLFQLRPWPKWCKIQAGMSSISVSSSVLFCAAWRLAMMYWFCQLCSVHSMLTWKGRVGLWREGLLVAWLWLDFLSLPFSSLCSCNGLSFCLPIPATLPYTQYTLTPIYHTSFSSTSASTWVQSSTYPLLSLFNSSYHKPPPPHICLSVHLCHRVLNILLTYLFSVKQC